MNPLGLLVMLGVFVLVTYGITLPAFTQRTEDNRRRRYVAAILSGLLITAAIWALIMFQAGAWETF